MLPMSVGIVANTVRALVANQLGEERVLRNPDTDWYNKSEERVAVFSYQRDFALLWGVDTNQEGLPAIGRALRARAVSLLKLVVVWDDVPSSDIPLVNWRRYLTPLDWAVALSLAIDQATEDEPGTEEAWKNRREYPALSMLILDLSSHLTHDADGIYFARQFAEGRIPPLPWVRLFGPIDGAPWSGPQRFLEALKTAGDTMSSSGKRSNLELLGRYWAAALTRPSNPDDHHAIANLLGPQLLLGSATFSASENAPDEQGQSALPGLVGARRFIDRRIVIGALGGLVKSIGLLGEAPDGGASEAWIDWNTALPSRATWGERVLAALGRASSKTLKILIVDDQWKDGWGEVVCHALGVAYAPEQTAVDGFCRIGNGQIPGHDAEVIIKAVQTAESLVDRIKAGNRYTLRLDSKEPEGLEIALVDLRLYAGKDVRTEAKFIQRLVEVVQGWGLDNKPRPPSWESIDDDELKSVSEWALEAIEKNDKRLRDDQRYHRGLTLLPMLIAQADPSYPIILFSSTGRRDILAPLDPYGNVFTEFEKPRLDSALGRDVTPRARVSFASVFGRALDFCGARALIASLPSYAPNTAEHNSRDSQGVWTMELYLDESGSEIDKKTRELDYTAPLTVGGILAVYPPGANPENFDNDLRTIEQIKDAVSDKNGKELIRNYRDQIVTDAHSKACGKGIKLIVVSLTGTLDDALYGSAERGAVDDEQVVDHLWRELNSCIIELAVYHYARQLCPASASIRYGVYLPTRHVPLANEQQKKYLFDTWGIETVTVGYEAPLFEAASGLSKMDTTDSRITQAQALLEQVKSERSPPKVSVRYFSFDSARPLVQRLTAQYRNALFSPQAEHARAYPITEACGRPVACYVRVLHLLADVVVDPKATVVDTLKIRGFLGNYGEDLQTLLRAARLLIHGLPGDALAACATLDDYGDDPLDVVYQLAQALRHAANKMPVQEFDVLARALRGNVAQRVLKPQLGGVVERVRANEYWIKAEDGNQYRVPKETMTDRLFNGDLVTLTVRRTLYGERNPEGVEKKGRNPKWRELSLGQTVIGTVAVGLDWGCYIDIGPIQGRLKGQSLTGGATVVVKIVKINEETGMLELMLCDTPHSDGT